MVNYPLKYETISIANEYIKSGWYKSRLQIELVLDYINKTYLEVRNMCCFILHYVALWSSVMIHGSLWWIIVAVNG